MASFREKICVKLYNHALRKKAFSYESEDDRGKGLQRVPFLKKQKYSDADFEFSMRP